MTDLVDIVDLLKNSAAIIGILCILITWGFNIKDLVTSTEEQWLKSFKHSCWISVAIIVATMLILG